MRRFSPRSGRGLGGIVLSLFLLFVLTKVFPEFAETESARAPAANVPANVNAAKPALLPTDPTPARIIKVVDGDTLDVTVNGEPQRIRVIGINTPETVDPRRPVQCFGREASAHAYELLDGQEVILTADPTQDEVDKYGRSLRYVEIVRGGDYGIAMITGGYAHEYTYERKYLKQADYRAAQKRAEEQGVGLWSSTTCAGDTTKAAASE